MEEKSKENKKWGFKKDKDGEILFVDRKGRKYGEDNIDNLVEACRKLNGAIGTLDYYFNWMDDLD